MPDLTELIIEDYRNKKRENISGDRAKSLQEWLESWLEARFDGNWFKTPERVRKMYFASSAAELLMLVDLEISLYNQEKLEKTHQQPEVAIDRDAEVAELNAFIQQKAPSYSVRWDGNTYEVLCNGKVHYRRPTAEQVKKLCQ